jgi:histidine kinase
MLTGVPPFRSADPMEIIHAHIARRPIFPSDLDSRIPDAISDITIKLLSKTAEERYQNGFGLMADLQECLDQYRRSGAIRKFTIARKDVSIRFLIPLVVYGREKEIDSLMSAFRRISKGRSELLLISGDPGIGKSAAVHEIQKPIISRGGYFISGKYDQFRQEVPYSAIIQALQGLVDMIITESDDKIALLRKNLARALGPNGGFVTSAIPRLELIIGRQKDIPESDDVESRNLFNNVLLNFIAVFADQEHPLILFLDDAHWADAASLGFIRRIMTDPEIKHLLLILSYRDQEADGAHPFMTTL